MATFEQARKASGMTLEAAARAVNVSVPTYMKKERDGSLFTFGEVAALDAKMDPDSRTLLWSAVDGTAEAAREERGLGDLTLGELFGMRNSGGRLDAELAEMRGTALKSA